MKWNEQNIESGLSVANQHPSVPGRFNVPMMIVGAPAPHKVSSEHPRRYFLISMQDGYMPFQNSEGTGMTAGELVDALNAQGFFPVPKVIRTNGTVSDLPENRLGLPFIIIGNGHS